MILICVFLSWLVFLVQNQSSLQWEVPKEVECSSITILISSSLGISTKYVNVTFSTAFSQIPTILLSLTRLQSFTNNLILYQETETVTQTGFRHKTIGNDHYNTVKKITGYYMAINQDIFSFMYPHVTQVSRKYFVILAAYLSTNLNPNIEYIQVQYLNPLNSSKTYEIGAFLTGFSANCVAGCQIGVHVQLYNQNAYLLRVSSKYGYPQVIQYTRILIDRTTEGQLPSGLNQLHFDMGYVQHFIQKDSIFVPGIQAFYQQSFFIGVKQFSTKFDLFNFTSIFIQLEDNPEQIKIFYLASKQKKCQISEPFYSAFDEACFQSCQIQHYQMSQAECGVCHEGCYQCTGPDPVDCTVCLQSYNREFDPTTNECVCLAGMISGPDYRCKFCADAIPGCDVCTNTTHCALCRQDCLSDNNNGCTCGETCLASEFRYVSPHTSECLCLPQYYLNQSTGDCDPCDKGCFICQGSGDNCQQCTDMYFLVESKCVYFVVSDAFLSKNPGHIYEEERCVVKIGNFCVAPCENPAKLYESKCYENECPTGKFSAIDPYGNYFCHPCKSPCTECETYYICDICQDIYFYRSPTGECLSCISNCRVCQNDTYCQRCENGFMYIQELNQCTLDIDGSIGNSECLEGCKQCLIQQFCEVCQNGYYLSEQTFQCIKCQNGTSGLIEYEPYFKQGVLCWGCNEICGDGIVINQGCDDKNIKGGDGCSDECEIEKGYECQYEEGWGQSICYKKGHFFEFESYRDLFSNIIYIQLAGNGIQSLLQPLMINCEGSYQITKTELVQTDSKNYKRFEIRMFSSLQNSKCEAYIQGAVGIQNSTYIVNTSPQALLIQSQQQYSGLLIGKTIFQSISQWVSIFIWIAIFFSIDPYENWALVYFCVLVLMMLYDYLHSMPNNYYLLGGLEYLVIRYGDYSTDTSTYLQNNEKILILFACILAFNQLLVRFLKNDSIFPVTQVAIFRRIFSQRFSTYYCIHLAFQPIIYLNSWYTIQGYLTTQNTQISTFTTNQIISIVILSCHGFCYIAALVFMIIQIRSILKYQPITDENKFHYKFAYILTNCKVLNILLVVSIIFNNSDQVLTSWGTAMMMLFWLIFVLMDNLPQILQPPLTLLPTEYDYSDEGSGESILSIDGRISDSYISTQANSCCSTSNARLFLRKICFTSRILTILIICACRITYYADYDYSVDVDSSVDGIGGQYYYQEYELLGFISSLSFILGIYMLPLLLSVILQIVILVHFAETDADVISEKLAEEQQKKQKKIAVNTHLQSRNSMSVLHIDEPSQVNQ